MPLIGNVLKSLAKSVLIPLGLTATASATDAVIHKKMFRSGKATLIISKALAKQLKMEQKNKKEDFLECS